MYNKETTKKALRLKKQKAKKELKPRTKARRNLFEAKKQYEEAVVKELKRRNDEYVKAKKVFRAD